MNSVASTAQRRNDLAQQSNSLAGEVRGLVQRPVTFAPGRVKLATRLVPTGSPAKAKTIGIADSRFLREGLVPYRVHKNDIAQT